MSYWIKLILPKRRYRSSGPGCRWVHVDDRCVHQSKISRLAAHSVLMERRQLTLLIDDQEYELPFKGNKETITTNGLQQQLVVVAKHIEHCIDLHKSFYHEQ